MILTEQLTVPLCSPVARLHLAGAVVWLQLFQYHAGMPYSVSSVSITVAAQVRLAVSPFILDLSLSLIRSGRNGGAILRGPTALAKWRMP